MRSLRTFAALLCLGLMAVPLAAQSRTPVLVDTDIGDAIDDALAVALALSSPELDVRGVTTVIDDVGSKTRLAWKELRLFGRRDIPVAMGAPEPLLDPALDTHPREFSVLTQADTIPDAARRPAADLIIQTLLNSRDRITLLAIGPLTNIALALKAEPRIKPRIERIVLMGGAYASNQIEYNVKRDPVAAEIVFRSGVPITAVGLDVTQPCKMREEDLSRLRAAESPVQQFLSRLIALSQAETGEKYPTLYDPLAVAVLFRPDLIGTEAGKVEVSLADSAGRGRTSFTPSQDGTTRVGVKVNAQEFLNLFIARVASVGLPGGPPNGLR
jgi:inosine-uridine nucleoside N-ribohydrolase